MACKAEHGVEEWWRFHTKPQGPSKHWGVVFHKPSWKARIKIDGTSLHLGTCEFEDDAGLVADFALVVAGREPKNFPEQFRLVEAWVEADKNGDVPAVARVELLGDVKKKKRPVTRVIGPLWRLSMIRSTRPSPRMKSSGTGITRTSAT